MVRQTEIARVMAETGMGEMQAYYHVQARRMLIERERRERSLRLRGISQ